VVKTLSIPSLVACCGKDLDPPATALGSNARLIKPSGRTAVHAGPRPAYVSAGARCCRVSHYSPIRPMYEQALILFSRTCATLATASAPRRSHQALSSCGPLLFFSGVLQPESAPPCLPSGLYTPAFA